MNNSINLYFEKGGKPSIILSKNDVGGIDMHCMTPGYTGSFSEEEASLLASAIKTLLGQENSLEPLEKDKIQ